MPEHRFEPKIKRTEDSEHIWQKKNGAEPRRIELTVPEGPIYTEQDVERWFAGAERYKIFEEAVPSAIKETEHWINVRGGIQAVFLGEKSAVFHPRLNTAYVTLAPDATLFDNAGLRYNTAYLYDPVQVAEVIKKYSDFFKDYDTTNITAFMDEFSKVSLLEANVQRGLLLGFPLASILEYERVGDLKIQAVKGALGDLLDSSSPLWKFFYGAPYNLTKEELIELFQQEVITHQNALSISVDALPELTSEFKKLVDAKSVNIHGVYWVDNAPSEESNIKQERLKAAFEQSGI